MEAIGSPTVALGMYVSETGMVYKTRPSLSESGCFMIHTLGVSALLSTRAFMALKTSLEEE
jgi:hypothetical protein